MKIQALLGLALAALVAAVPGVAPAQTPADPLAGEEGDSPGLEAIARFATVYRLIKQAHVDPVDDEKLIESAIHGMLAGLDPHSGYLDLDALAVLTDDTLGAYDGLGIEVLSGEGILQVIGAMPDSPAARADLRPGDRITHVDGTQVERDNLDESVRKLRGRPGTRIRLTVERVDEARPRDIELVRARIRLSSVRIESIGEGQALVEVSQCRQDTPGELRRRLRQFDRRHGPLQGLVLDLRGNPGGALDCAIGVADLFLAEGRIVRVQGRLSEANQVHDARPGDAWETIRLAVLIDQDTASAAEIIAAALQDHGRAVLLGRRSYGKGSVQNVFGLDRSHAVRLTTARYYTADGRSIHGRGVDPDIVLADEAIAGGLSDADGPSDPALADAAIQRALLELRRRVVDDEDRVSKHRFD